MHIEQTSREGSLMGRFKELGLVRDYSSIEGDRMKVVVAQFDYDTAGYRLKFDHDVVLDNARITAIEVVDSLTTNSNPKFTAPSGDFIGNPTVSQLSKMVFVLASKDEQLVVLPAVNAVKRLNAGKPVFMDSCKHTWGDSYIELTEGSVVTAGTSVFTINVWYQPK